MGKFKFVLKTVGAATVAALPDIVDSISPVVSGVIPEKHRHLWMIGVLLLNAFRQKREHEGAVPPPPPTTAK